ncbi:MaoC family dehydratase [Actinotignum sanguinis]|uniref:MaoC family dehydratase n=1 Tax=Actinotignum sanguinis TaxID=1445614 RepID=UPI002934B807|nr:MaoC family dehydratase [Actinotignum sanguinis]MDV2436983.1 MaoC family dehydratase [Actinotignum sanguinis]
MQARRYAAILAAAARQKLSRRAVPRADELPRVKVHAVAERPVGEGIARFAGGGVGGHAPAALLHQLCLGPTLDILADTSLPLVATGAVITDLRWEILSPVPFGRPLTVRAWAASFERDEKGTALRLAADISYDGAVCYREIARYLDRGSTGSPVRVTGEEPQLGGADLDFRTEFGVDEAGHLRYASPHALAERRFTAADARHWARLTGDINPIHLSGATARLFGFSGAVLHGAATDAWACGQLGLRGDAPGRGEVTFRAPLVLPQKVVLRAVGEEGAVAVVEERTGRDLVHLRYTSAELHEAQGGIVLPIRDGKPSSTAVSRGMVEVFAAGDAALATALEDAIPWRRTYREPYAQLTRLDDPARGADAAHAGLNFVHHTLTLHDGTPLAKLRPRGGTPRGEIVRGTTVPCPFTVPFRGREIPERWRAATRWDARGDYVYLSGTELLDHLARWEEQGRVQPGVLAALTEVVHHPEMMRLEGRTVAVLGAGAELSPAPTLLATGAQVAGVGRSESRRMRTLRARALEAAGDLHIAPAGFGDVTAAPDAVAGWLLSLPGDLVVVDTLYAPGYKFLLVEAGADAVLRMVGEESNAAFAWYGSPTDAYPIPGNDDAAAGAAELPGGVVSRTAIRSWAKLSGARPAREAGVVNLLQDIQGPNYAAAKRIGRWRATVEREAGRTISYTIAPMSRTESVLISQPLRAGYAGLERLGYPPLAADTAAALLTGLLVWDLQHPEATASSTSFLTNRALDGGLLSIPYQPNDLAGLALLSGAEQLLGRHRGPTAGRLRERPAVGDASSGY